MFEPAVSKITSTERVSPTSTSPVAGDKDKEAARADLGKANKKNRKRKKTNNWQYFFLTMAY
jgi:hypothetical protein